MYGLWIDFLYGENAVVELLGTLSICIACIAEETDNLLMPQQSVFALMGWKEPSQVSRKKIIIAIDFSPLHVPVHIVLLCFHSPLGAERVAQHLAAADMVGR